MDCENKSNPEGQGYVLPAPSEETCPGSSEGIATHAVDTICARDMSVGAVFSTMFLNGYQNKKINKKS